MQQGAVFRVERGLPQLLCIHLAQPLIARDFQAAPAIDEYCVKQFGWPHDCIICGNKRQRIELHIIIRDRVRLRRDFDEPRRPRVGFGMAAGEAMQLARLCAGKEACFDLMYVRNTAPQPLDTYHAVIADTG